MQNPKVYMRVNGKYPSDFPTLGYRLPFEYAAISDLINRYTADVGEVKTIQIQVVPSLDANKTKVLLISSEIRHPDADISHSVMLISDKTRKLISSSVTLEGLFDNLKKPSYGVETKI